jgi:hypothetical protein
MLSWFHLSPEGGKDRPRDINDAQCVLFTHYDLSVKRGVFSVFCCPLLKLELCAMCICLLSEFSKHGVCCFPSVTVILPLPCLSKDLESLTTLAIWIEDRL